jgi:transposase-like protein
LCFDNIVKGRNTSQVTEEVKGAVSTTINQLLNAEMEMFLGSPEQSDNRRNGYLPERTYTLKGIGSIRVKIPVDRKGQFQSSVIPKYERIDPRLEADMAILHLAGLSTRTLSMISKSLLGIDVNKDTVNQSLGTIQNEALLWLTRPLEKRYWALYVDGTNFRIQRRGGTEKEPSLVVLGIDEHNYKSIIAIEPGTRDSAECWRTVFHELKNRGLDPKCVRIGIMDGLPGLEKTFNEEFTKAVTARCWRHAMQNIMNKVSKRSHNAFKSLVKEIMYASSEDDARQAYQHLKQTMGKDEVRAVLCLEKDLESLLVHYQFDRSCWLALKTTNSIERVNKELKRRYKSMEKIGEGNLMCLLAFTALRLEMGWRKNPVTSKAVHNLKYLQANVIEETVSELKIVK